MNTAVQFSQEVTLKVLSQLTHIRHLCVTESQTTE